MNLIDIHCHLLPAIDDGAKHMEMSVAMAKIAVDEGITHLVCTPHIYPGVYDNTAHTIQAAVNTLQTILLQLHIPLQLYVGADTHLVPGLLARLEAGDVPTINHGRYLLLEPAHHVVTPKFESAVLALLQKGYIPIITHPERLAWIDSHYEVFERLVSQGVWMQITAGSITGVFGKKAQYWADKLLHDGMVHVIATDAHNLQKKSTKSATSVGACNAGAR
jgi:protein-tyrosine phosphatase